MKIRNAQFGGGTGFQPVKSGILPDLRAPAMSISKMRHANRAHHAVGFGQDARNNRPEACSTQCF